MAPRHTPSNPIRILFATSEVRPLIKTGGLADVSAALPVALHHLGADVRVLIPGYRQVLASLKKKHVQAKLSLPFGHAEIHLLSANLPGTKIPILIVDYPPFFDREGGPYLMPNGMDWPDNALRFGLLSWVAAKLAQPDSPLDWQPDVIQCNDWQTGMTPAYLHYAPHRVPCVMAIHNLAYQGIFSPDTVSDLGLPHQCFDINGVEYYGNVSFLKAGIHYADHITTVSPTYAEEIQVEPLGFGFQGLLSHRGAQLTGILNGIDLEVWNPQKDGHLFKNFSVKDLSGKAANKQDLQEKLGLEINPDIPLLAVISRITHQKGLDLLLQVLPEVLQHPAQFVLLGSGETALEQAFQRLAKGNKGQVSATIGYNEDLSHQIEAGADIFLMPSRFEPCGLNQMYSMRYGTLPVVHCTGGLADTVTDASPENVISGKATGFVFHQMETEDIQAAIVRAMTAYHDKHLWQTLQRNAMARDFSWDRSAKEYLDIYSRLKLSAIY